MRITSRGETTRGHGTTIRVYNQDGGPSKSTTLKDISTSKAHKLVRMMFESLEKTGEFHIILKGGKKA